MPENSPEELVKLPFLGYTCPSFRGKPLLSLLPKNSRTMKKFLAPVLGLLLAVSLLTIEPAAAQLIDPADSPNNITTATGGEGSARSLARTIINFFLYFLGLVATIMVIYGGFLYITAGGGDTEKAKKVLLYAAIGIIVVLISFALVNTLLRSADGVSTGF